MDEMAALQRNYDQAKQEIVAARRLIAAARNYLDAANNNLSSRDERLAVLSRAVADYDAIPGVS